MNNKWWFATWMGVIAGTIFAAMDFYFHRTLWNGIMMLFLLLGSVGGLFQFRMSK
jgi:hypothetical protein